MSALISARGQKLTPRSMYNLGRGTISSSSLKHEGCVFVNSHGRVLCKGHVTLQLVPQSHIFPMLLFAPTGTALIPRSLRPCILFHFIKSGPGRCSSPSYLPTAKHRSPVEAWTQDRGLPPPCLVYQDKIRRSSDGWYETVGGIPIRAAGIPHDADSLLRGSGYRALVLPASSAYTRNQVFITYQKLPPSWFGCDLE